MIWLDLEAVALAWWMDDQFELLLERWMPDDEDWWGEF